MIERTATAVWNGNLEKGHGQTRFAAGACNLPYSAGSRFGKGEGTNPEELIGAAHAACFSMALSHELAEAGHIPNRVETKATVRLEKTDGGYAITRITLRTQGEVPGVDAHTFQEHAARAKDNCPVSKALAGTEIALDAELAEQ